MDASVISINLMISWRVLRLKITPSLSSSREAKRDKRESKPPAEEILGSCCRQA